MYQIAFVAVVGSMAFWGGMAIMAIVMLGANLVTFRFQVAEPPKRKPIHKIARLTGIASELLWPTIESWHSAGYKVLLYHQQRAVDLYTVILEKEYA